MRIPNEPVDDPGGPLAELLRLQTQFQARLAEEALGYMRRLQGATAPAAPGTVLVPDPDTTLEARGGCGATVELRVELENRQRVHCMVRPLLGELVSAQGVTWHPEADVHPPTRLVAPGETAEVVIAVVLPRVLPAATYRGSLVLLGFRKGGLPVSITAEAAETEPASPAKDKAASTANAPAESKAHAPAKSKAHAPAKSKAKAPAARNAQAPVKAKATARPRRRPAEPPPAAPGPEQ